MKGAGTDDSLLIRIVVSRSEVIIIDDSLVLLMTISILLFKNAQSKILECTEMLTSRNPLLLQVCQRKI